MASEKNISLRNVKIALKSQLEVMAKRDYGICGNNRKKDKAHNKQRLRKTEGK